jgi:menaquinone-specific isochorismate synthase
VIGPPEHLVAVRLPLDPGPPIDPYALAGPTGSVFRTRDRVLVGLGSALVIPLPQGLGSPADVREVARTLDSLQCDDRCGAAAGTSAVIGFGSLPFERSRPSSLVVPRIIYGAESSGPEWVTVFSNDRAELPTKSAGLRAWLVARTTAGSSGLNARATSGGTPQVGIFPRSSDGAFEAMVADAVGAIHRGELDKVVLARQVDVHMSETIDVAALLRRWHRLEPDCAVFSMPAADGQFVGASPELLVDRTGRRVQSRPLAGTTDRFSVDDGVLPRELLASRKDADEHRLVVEAIAEALTPLCSALDVPAGPDLVHLHTITHLGSSLTGTLDPRSDGTIPTALDLVALLHPTPAVGGVPSRQALDLISRLEPQPRGHYAGPVGYVDSRGDGRWMIGIRALSIRDRRARLAAGVGVVEGSQPSTELAETSLKLTAAFDALAPDVPFSTHEHPSAREAVS